MGLGEDSAPGLTAAPSHWGLHVKAAEATIAAVRDMPAVPHPVDPIAGISSSPGDTQERLRPGSRTEPDERHEAQRPKPSPMSPRAGLRMASSRSAAFRRTKILAQDSPPYPGRCPTSRHMEFKALKE